MLDLDYLRGDFNAFYPAEVTCCTNGDEIWHGGVDRHLLHTNLPHWCRGGVAHVGTKPTGHIPSAILIKSSGFMGRQYTLQVWVFAEGVPALPSHPFLHS